MMWWWTVPYLLAGYAISLIVSEGHQVIHGTKMPWPSWVAVTVGYPIMFLFGWIKL